jgi:DNA-binding PadR family transcriptional regulator
MVMHCIHQGANTARKMEELLPMSPLQISKLLHSIEQNGYVDSAMEGHIKSYTIKPYMVDVYLEVAEFFSTNTKAYSARG